MADNVILIAGWLLFGSVLLAVVPTVLVTMSRRLMCSQPPTSTPDDPPVLSVIVAAKDEAPNIEAAVTSLLAQDYPALQVIAVNDRSEDRTGEILDRLQAEDSRLSVVHVEQLPDEWLGKNHAMHQASKAATGEVLLFTDGDVKFHPSALRSAMDYVNKNDVDHLCVFPEMITNGYWERALVTFFGFCFCVGLQSWLVPTALRFAYVGVGAFNLVRRTAYDRIGGHTALKFEVLDDVKLGKLLKRSGAKAALLRGNGLVSVRWQPSAWGVITGLEKNGFASLDYSVFKLALTTLAWLVFFVSPYVMLAACPDLRCGGFAATVLLYHAAYALLGHFMGAGIWLFPVFPVASLGMAYAFWRSSWITLRQGGVQWRDTFYSLRALRERRVR